MKREFNVAGVGGQWLAVIGELTGTESMQLLQQLGALRSQARHGPAIRGRFNPDEVLMLETRHVGTLRFHLRRRMLNQEQCRQLVGAEHGNLLA